MFFGIGLGNQLVILLLHLVVAAEMAVSQEASTLEY